MLNTTRSVKRIAAVIGVVATAVALPATASAATYVLRPTSTQSLQAGWTTTPSSTPADAVLDKAVSQPAVPDPGSYLAVDGAGSWSAVGLSAPPAFATGETLSRTTAWAYLSSDPSRSVTLSLWTGSPTAGYTILGSTTVPGGQGGGWYSISASAPLSSSQLGQLTIALQGGGSGGTARVFAAYAQLDTSTPDSSPAPAVETGSVPSDVSIVTPSVTLTPNQSDVGVELSCAAGTSGGCHGVLILRSLGGSGARAASVHAVAARCARGCRILGRQSFSIAAGKRKRVSVHLAHSARHLVRSHHRVKAQAVVVTRDNNGDTQITKSTVDLSQGSGGGQSPTPAQSSRKGA